MSGVEVVFALIKILIIIGFLMNMGGVLTWVERRQMSMIQDRVGPNRAVIYLPSGVAKGAVAGLAVLLAVAAIGLFLTKAIPAVVVGVLLLGLAGALGFGATKVSGDEQGRVGLRLAGLLHPLADGVKFITKESFVPPNADKLLHALAPIIAVFPVFVTFAVVPFGDTLCMKLGAGEHWWQQLANARIPQSVERLGTCAEGGVGLQLVNLDVGMLYIFALAGTGIIGAAIAGWASDNKFALLGGLRAASQMVSYEVGLGLSVVGAFMIFGTVRLDDMVRWQSDHAWGIFVQPLGAVLFLAAAIAEQKRVPFDAPEGESEIVAGYFLEYSGMTFALFMMGEYVELAVSSAIFVTLFLGGWALPFLHRDGITIAFGDTVLWHQPLLHWVVILIGALAFFGKTILFTWFQVFIRWTVPRFRYDQIMKLGWRRLLPAALVNMAVTAVVLLAIDQGGVPLSNALGVAGDVTQAIVAVVGAGLAVWFVVWALQPVKHEKSVVSTSAKYAAARGGVKSSPMQA